MEPIVIRPLGLATLLPNKIGVLLTRKVRGRWGWLLGWQYEVQKDFCDQTCLRNTSYSFPPMEIENTHELIKDSKKSRNKETWLTYLSQHLVFS